MQFNALSCLETIKDKNKERLTTEIKRITTDSQLLTIYKYMKERKARTLNVRITTREKRCRKGKKYSDSYQILWDLAFKR